MSGRLTLVGPSQEMSLTMGVLSREGSWEAPASGCHQLSYRVGRYEMGVGGECKTEAGDGKSS